MNGIHVGPDLVERITCFQGGLPQAHAMEYDKPGNSAGLGREGRHLKGDELESFWTYV